MKQLSFLLQNHLFVPIIQETKPCRKLDFSADNTTLAKQKFENVGQFSEYVFQDLLSNNEYMGIGGYRENRVIYSKLQHFGGGEIDARNLHLGTDIWANAGTVVFAPMDGTIHSFHYNNHEGDYGPTIILKHQLDNHCFYTLYGHLSLDSIVAIKRNQLIKAGTALGQIGDYPENGNWPAHLHFQIIEDIGSFQGDYPGVCNQKDSDYFFQNCPNPNLILKVAENNL